MTTEKKKGFDKLRERAERKLTTQIKKSKRKQSTSNEHELDVRQVELELQNEELICAQTRLMYTIDEYSELFEQAPVGYFILNEAGAIQKVNETGGKQLALNKSQIIGKYFSTFLRSEYCQDNFYRHRNAVIETRDKHQMECEIKRADGSVFYCLIESRPFNQSDKRSKAIISTVIDISNRRKHESALEAALNKEKELNELKSRFITIASHEFRTPLASILLSTDLIEKYEDKKYEEKRKTHFLKIRRSVHRLREILVDFMSADEIEKSGVNNVPSEFSLVEFMKDVIDETRSYNGTHEVVYKHRGSVKNVLLDKRSLKTSVINIIVNAYKYSPNGGLIEIISEQTRSGDVIITVKDEGIGIPVKSQKHVFEQFYRAKNAENFQGTGMGLNISQKLIHHMGGSITFESEESKGSIFCIKLPKKSTVLPKK